MVGETRISLIERVRNGGDNAAWKEFVDLYRPMLGRWLAARGVSTADADDVQQEIMVVLMKELPGFEHNGRAGAFRCWLRLVMANRLQTLWRKKKQSQKVIGESDYEAIAKELEDPDSRLSVLWNADHDRHVCQHLVKMVQNEFQQKTVEAFQQVALEGRKAPEVAATLGISANAVRIAQTRVLARLREIGQGLIT